MYTVFINTLTGIAVSIGITLITWIGQKIISILTLKIKDHDAKQYLTGAVNIVTDAVKSVYQTFVEALKKECTFTEEAQAEALEQAKNIINFELTEKMKEYIIENSGDLNLWITTTIHSVLYDLKKE